MKSQQGHAADALRLRDDADADSAEAPNPDEGQDVADDPLEVQQKILLKPLILLRDLHRQFLHQTPEGLDLDEMFGFMEDHKASFQKQMEEPMDVTVIKSIERGLEGLLWQIYGAGWKDLTEQHVMFVADPQAVGFKEKVALVSAPDDLDLLYVGPVTSCGKASNSKFLCNIFGIDFFVSPPGGDIIVPAWHCKTTTKKDAATVYQDETQVTFWVKSDGSVVSTDPGDVDDWLRSVADSKSESVAALTRLKEKAESSCSQMTSMVAQVARMKNLTEQEMSKHGDATGSAATPSCTSGGAEVAAETQQQPRAREQGEEASEEAEQKTELKDEFGGNDVPGTTALSGSNPEPFADAEGKSAAATDAETLLESATQAAQEVLATGEEAGLSLMRSTEMALMTGMRTLRLLAPEQIRPTRRSIQQQSPLTLLSPRWRRTIFTSSTRRPTQP